MRRFQRLFFAALCAATLLSACGKANSHRDLSTAVLTLSTQGTQTALSGIEVTILLPAGVGIKTDATSSLGLVDSSAITASGVAAGHASVLALFTAASSTPATIALLVSSSSPSGFGVGQFATVRCDIHSGSPKASDFSLAGFDPRDLLGNPVSSLTATFSAEIH